MPELMREQHSPTDSDSTDEVGETEDAIKALDDWWNMARESAIRSLDASKNSSEKIRSISSAIMLSS